MVLVLSLVSTTLATSCWRVFCWTGLRKAQELVWSPCPRWLISGARSILTHWSPAKTWVVEDTAGSSFRHTATASFVMFFLRTSWRRGWRALMSPATVFTLVSPWISFTSLFCVSHILFSFTQVIFHFQLFCFVFLSWVCLDKSITWGINFNLTPTGIVKTELSRHVSLWQKVFIEPIAWLLFLDTTTGAQTTLHCTLQEGIEPFSGRYFSCCTMQEVSHKARDNAVARKLWDVSEKLCGLS